MGRSPLGPSDRCALGYHSLTAAQRACEEQIFCDGISLATAAQCWGTSAYDLTKARAVLYRSLSKRSQGVPRGFSIVRTAAENVELAARRRWLVSLQDRGPRNETLDQEKHFALLGVSMEEGLRAIDTLPRLRTENSSIEGDAALEQCGGTVVMVDNRDLTNSSTYWVKAIKINRAYAIRHGYRFLLLRPQPGKWIRSLRRGKHAVVKGVPWCKVKALQRVVERERNESAGIPKRYKP